MTRKQYRRLTPQERHYLIEHYANEPQAISVIAIHLQLEPKKVLEQARYLKLRPHSSRHSWSEAELHLLDEWAETKPLNQLVASWNRLALKQGIPQRSFRSLEKKLLERGHSLKPFVNYFSVPTVATLLNRSESWIKGLIENQKLCAVKENGYWLVKPKWLRNFVFNHPYDATARINNEQFADLLLAIADCQ
jgi:hypothetical protein